MTAKQLAFQEPSLQLLFFFPSQTLLHAGERPRKREKLFEGARDPFFESCTLSSFIFQWKELVRPGCSNSLGKGSRSEQRRATFPCLSSLLWALSDVGKAWSHLGHELTHCVSLGHVLVLSGCKDCEWRLIVGPTLLVW